MNAYNKMIVVIVLLSVGCYTFNQFFILILFKANQDFIAQNLCENRDKPQMKCCGKCLLKKKLAQSENNSTSKQFPSKIDKAGIDCCVLPNEPNPINRLIIPPAIQHPKLQHMYAYDYLQTLLHPPPFVG
jgi:hypothetical protein